MWDLINEFNISLKIVQDLLIGIKSDIKDRVELNSKKDLLIYSYSYLIKLAASVERSSSWLGIDPSRILSQKSP